VERRRSPRYELHVPVICRWKDDQGSHELGGFSRDISRWGVFVVSVVLPSEGTKMTVEIRLPALQARTQELRLQCDGALVWVQRGAATYGFAVECDFEASESSLTTNS